MFKRLVYSSVYSERMKIIKSLFGLLHSAEMTKKTEQKTDIGMKRGGALARGGRDGY